MSYTDDLAAMTDNDLELSAPNAGTVRMCLLRFMHVTPDAATAWVQRHAPVIEHCGKRHIRAYHVAMAIHLFEMGRTK